MTVAEVSPPLALGSDRQYIAVQHGELSWHYPLQFRSDELRAILSHVRRWDWRLDADGKPIELTAIHRGVESLIDRLPSDAKVGGER